MKFLTVFFFPTRGVRTAGQPFLASGEITLTEEMMAFLHLKPEMRLLSIRSSDIAFIMGAKGPLLEKVAHFDGETAQF